MVFIHTKPDVGGKKLNKPTLEDLATGVYSLPILLALSHDNLRLRLDPILAKKREMTLEDIDQIQEIILCDLFIA